MGARLVAPAEGLERAALPVAGARKRDGVGDAVRDAGEVGERGRRIFEEAQRDPASRELLLGTEVLLDRRRRVARDPVSGLRVLVEKLAQDEPSLRPPLVAIVQQCGVARHGEHEFGRFGDLVVAPQPLDAAENITRIAARLRRHGVEQGLGAARLVDHGHARFRDRKLVAAEPLGGAHARLGVVGVEAAIHPRLMIGARQ